MSQIHRKRRGNAAIVALSLIPVIGFGALSVDIGMQRTTSLQIQSAAEAGALAGSARLNGSVAGITDAVDFARTIAQANQVYSTKAMVNTTLFSDTADVQAGVYNSATNTFTPYTNQDASTVNAVRVMETDRMIDSILAKAAFGIATLGVEGAATSIQPRGGVPAYVDCFLPIAIPSCTFEALDASDGAQDNVVNTNPAPVKIFVNGGGDTGGFAVPMSSSPASNQTIGDLFADGCSAETASTGELIDPNNGALNSQSSSLVTVINDGNPGGIPQNGDLPWSNYDENGPVGEDVAITWPPATIPADGAVDNTSPPFGRTIAGAIPIVRVDGTSASNCSGFNWGGSLDIVGWSYGYIYDADPVGNDKGVYVQADFLNTYDIGYGQCVEDEDTPELECMGNVTGTFPSSLVL